MKRFALAALAVATAAAPLVPQIAAADPYDHRGSYDRHDRDRDGRWDHNRGDGRYDRGGDRWDSSRHNGYYYQNRWYYGAPPSSYYGRPGFRADYRAWRRGDRLPGYYRERYREVDWRYARLRQPPRGYHYVRDDRGGYLLVGIATGVILGSILNNGY